MVDDTSPERAPDDDLAALDFFAPVAVGEDDATEGGTELLETTYTVTNPPGTVTVSALRDGRIHRVDLSRGVTSMTEAELADEIVVIARLATQDARAAQYTTMLDGMRQQGHDDFATRDFLARDLDLPSPEEAIAARAHVFTTRYAGEE